MSAFICSFLCTIYKGSNCNSLLLGREEIANILRELGLIKSRCFLIYKYVAYKIQQSVLLHYNIHCTIHKD